jgi:hypothetical protein
MSVSDTTRYRSKIPVKDLFRDDTVTNDDGVLFLSMHQKGLAIDITPADEKGNPIWPSDNDPRWAQIAGYMKSHGLVWGGDWKDFPDRPHYQFNGE